MTSRSCCEIPGLANSPAALGRFAAKGCDVIHYQGANNLPDAQSQLVVTMFAASGRADVDQRVGKQAMASSHWSAA